MYSRIGILHNITWQPQRPTVALLCSLVESTLFNRSMNDTIATIYLFILFFFIVFLFFIIIFFRDDFSSRARPCVIVCVCAVCCPFRWRIILYLATTTTINRFYLFFASFVFSFGRRHLSFPVRNEKNNHLSSTLLYFTHAHTHTQIIIKKKKKCSTINTFDFRSPLFDRNSDDRKFFFFLLTFLMS